MTVDILMATHDGGRYVAEQIESILWQDFADWRLLVSDDCSSDATLDVVRSYVSRDPRVVLASEGVRFGSAKANFMHLLSLADAPYAMFCDQDDVWLPEKVGSTLAKMREVEAAGEEEKPILTFCDMAIVDADLQLVSVSFERFAHLKPERSKLQNVLSQALGAGCTFMMNHALCQISSMCDNVNDIIMHDWWVALAASALGQISFNDSPLSLYRLHESNTVGTKRYNPIGWISRIDDMSESQIRISRQANCFARTYRDILSSAALRISLNCAAITEVESIRGLAALVDCNALKPGLRSIGQIVAILNRGGVVAIIVTYNPNPERLIRNFEAIRLQVDAIFVLDNGSANVANLVTLFNKYCDFYRLEVSNVGLSKTLNEGCSLATALGAKYALLLDQDSIAQRDMVNGLLLQTGRGIGLVSPQIVDRNKNEEFVVGLPTKDILRAITSGALLSLEAWLAVGGFDEQLFVDWVDYELCANLRLHGYRIVKSNRVWLLHEMGRREHVFTVLTPSCGMQLYRTNHALARQKDKARSWAIVRRKYGWTKVGIQERIYIDMIVLRDLLLERRRVSIFKIFIEGYFEGRKLVQNKNREYSNG